MLIMKKWDGPSDFDLWSAHRNETWRSLLEALKEAVEVHEGADVPYGWYDRARAAIRDAEREIKGRKVG